VDYILAAVGVTLAVSTVWAVWHMGYACGMSEGEARVLRMVGLRKRDKEVKDG